MEYHARENVPDTQCHSECRRVLNISWFRCGQSWTYHFSHRTVATPTPSQCVQRVPRVWNLKGGYCEQHFGSIYM